MKLPENISIPKNIRPHQKKTRFYVDNEVLEIYGPKLKSSGIAIYCALARHANSKTQSCFPSYPRIMKLSGVGKRNTVSKYLKILEELGLIIIDRNKKREPNVYFLLKIHSTQIDTKEFTQKDKQQYLNSGINSAERDTLNQINNSNKEIEDFSLKEELKKPRFRDYKPDFLK